MRDTSFVISPLSFFPRYRQPEHRGLSGSGNIQSAGRLRIGQVQRLTMLAAINLGIGAPVFFYITARLLNNVCGVKPPFEMPAAELSFRVFLVAGALPRLLEFNLVIWKLRSGLRYSSGGQSVLSSQSRQSRRIADRP